MKYERLLSGYSYDTKGAYLKLDNMNLRVREKLYLDSISCSIKMKDSRYCVGRFNLSSLSSTSCPTYERLPSDYKGISCCKCVTYTGFNPAFYNATAISPQQQKYNKLPHMVYLAYFAPNKVKVGIAAKYRIAVRLLEQGARAAVILKEFPDAYQARELERYINKDLHYPDNFQSSQKRTFLQDFPYSFEKAMKYLGEAVKQIGISPLREAMDLQDYYFYHKKYDIHELIYCKDPIINGKCIGMIGDAVVIEQNKYYFTVSIKPYISHLVEITDMDTAYQYPVPEKQLTLFDLFGTI